MTFTKDVPTVPGDYRWRRDINDTHPLLIEIYNSGDRLFAWREGVGYVESKWHAWGGEWCRLVPADVVTGLSEAIEGLCKHVPAAEDHAQFTPLQKEVSQALKALARAKRVMEGRE